MPTCTTEDAETLAFVQTALDTSQSVLPNMFAPFIIPSDHTVSDIPVVHWGNVDTGAMVNVVYLGVTRVFQYLQKFWVKYEHVLYGVGGKRTNIVAMLKDVPLHIGTDRCPSSRDSSSLFTATFLVVDNDDYHWILGIPLLAALNAKVSCKERVLEYTPINATTATSIGLITRDEARAQPVRMEFRQKSPHLESETVEEATWETTMLHQEEIRYVGLELTDLLGRHYA